MDYAQARYYNSQHGRFTSVDPLMASANVVSPQTWNRYSYVLNNPLNMVDPLGMKGDCPKDVPNCYEKDGKLYTKGENGEDVLIDTKEEHVYTSVAAIMTLRLYTLLPSLAPAAGGAVATLTGAGGACFLVVASACIIATKPNWSRMQMPAYRCDYSGNGCNTLATEQVLKMSSNESSSANAKNGGNSGATGDRAPDPNANKPDVPKNVHNSVKDSPNYPAGFREAQNGTQKYNVKNKELLENLRKVESGKWNKVYKDGFDGNGNKVSVHYFQSQSGKVFDVQPHQGWSNLN